MATSINNLAALYDSQGRYEEAEPLFLQALALRKKLLGTEHPNAVTGLENFVGFLMQVVSEGQESLLSEHPFVQKLLAIIKEKRELGI